MFSRSRDQLAQELKLMAEVALYRANLLNTTELATLQAFTIYIGAIRVLDPSQRAWSMIALLVRLARNLGIHRELAGEKIFIAELRRRLWYSIVLLDCYASSDRGTEMAIHPHTFDRQLPHNANDSDFDENTKIIVDREGEITESTMSLITQEGSIAALQLFHDETCRGGETWEERLEIAYTFQRQIQSKYLQYCENSNPLHHQLIAAGTAASKGLILRAIRPIQHSSSSTGPPPRVDSPWVMQLAVEILRQQHELWEMFLQTRGRRMPWVPWHAMAVALAGICSMEVNELTNEAWELCEMAMRRYRNEIADTENGMLWRPIQKIYGKAKSYRESQKVKGVGGMAWSKNSDVRNEVTIEYYSTVLDAVWSEQGVNDESWLDWEGMLRDMDEMKACDMLWM
ncbi:C6 finger domain transcription factor adaR [Pseudocercospora fuligena]|uniref:C6 finger domain transcription factor adaR n=1 Tax=Pseudocercospora fuligena TaxID=685502 RepID=A0A8H6R823_9PEZI|nr:C6 finger domain transcription factor adaR [Pseudocercospora fuligena]